ncbi:MAG TPA: tyrosine-type recombinase/integrase [Acidimicrobiia bacterium]|nr:tyrosine-type recombinase/integrase [Acidimicrobiia bacterium]
MAHIDKRLYTTKDGKQKIYWRARYRDPRGRERVKNFTRRIDAERFLVGIEHAKLKAEWTEPRLGKIRFDAYAAEWLATKADVGPQTLSNVQGRLRKHIVPTFGASAMAAVRPADVRKFVGNLVEAGLAPSTVKSIYLTASQVFAQAVTDGLISRSPCIGIRLPEERQREQMHFLTPDQVDVLAEAITPRFSALVYAAAYTGMRAGELGALRLGRLNLLAGTVDVAASMMEVGGHLVVGPTKTGRPRTLTLPRFLAEMLGEHVGRYPSPEGFVFTMAEGGPIRQRNFYRRHFKPAVLDADLPAGLHFHSLRHTCAAFLIADGRHMEEVKDHLGHSSIRVTSDRYGHLFPKARQAVADGLDETFRRAGGRNAATKMRPKAPVLPSPNASQEPEKGP